MTGERITRANLEQRAENVNRRLEHTGRFVMVQGRNGYIGLDECERSAKVDGRELTGQVLRTLTVGTKREVGDFLHAMMVGIDLSRIERGDTLHYTRGIGSGATHYRRSDS